MKNKIRFVFKWSWVTILGWYVGQFLGLLLTKILFPQAGREILFAAPLVWLVFGMVFGLSQWFVLKDQIHSIRSWVFATAISFYIGALLLKTMTLFNIILSNIWNQVLFGAILGLAQYLILRNRIMNAGWWLFTIIASWALTQQISESHNLWIQLFGVFVFTVVTGVVIERLLQYQFQNTA